MGFWGTFVVHRDERLLWDLLPDCDVLNSAELCIDGVSGGWQVTRVHVSLDGLPSDFLAALSNATNAPALVADVLDSDGALVNGIGPRTQEWRAWLNLDRAISFLTVPPAPFDENGNFLGEDWTDPQYEMETAALKQRLRREMARAPDAAAAWAAEAGLPARPPSDIEALLGRNELFVEDLFFTFLDLLGIATEDNQLPVRPRIGEVLQSLCGKRIEAVDAMSHKPMRGERLAFPNMQDILISFDGGQSVAVCGCAGELAVLPADEDIAAEPPQQDLAKAISTLSDVVGRQLTDTATARQGYLPFIVGMVLRFDENHDVFIASIDGQWTIHNGSAPPAHLRDEVHLNAWASTFQADVDDA